MIPAYWGSDWPFGLILSSRHWRPIAEYRGAHQIPRSRGHSAHQTGAQPRASFHLIRNTNSVMCTILSESAQDVHTWEFVLLDHFHSGYWLPLAMSCLPLRAAWIIWSVVPRAAVDETGAEGDCGIVDDLGGLVGFELAIAAVGWDERGFIRPIGPIGPIRPIRSRWLPSLHAGDDSGRHRRSASLFFSLSGRQRLGIGLIGLMGRIGPINCKYLQIGNFESGWGRRRQFGAGEKGTPSMPAGVS